MFSNYRLRNYNFKLLILTIAACIIGTIVIYSANNAYLQKQVAGMVICIIGMIVLSLIDYKLIAKFSVLIYLIGLILLLLVEFVGYTVNNAQRWLGSEDVITIQPSEFTKIILIICVAAYLERHKETINSFWTILAVIAMFVPNAILIVMQPDLSTAIVLTLIILTVFFVAGLSYKIIGVAFLILIPLAGSFLWYIQTPNQILLKEYQLTRVLTFIYPQDYLMTTFYQQNNSIMAIGSGQLTGKGLNSSTMATVKDANLISEQQTDFIFSVVGEELGFVGSVIIIAILGVIVLQCIKIGRKAKDDTGMLIATGVAAMIAYQAFINVGVATAILPNTGIPLPFISYGLTSLVSACAGIGLVLNIGLQRKKY